MPKKPLWIAISGVYGTGKTTLVEEMFNSYKEKGKRVIKCTMPFQDYGKLEKLKDSTDIHNDILKLASWTRSITQQIREIQASGMYDIIISDGSVLDVLLFASMYSYMYTDVTSILGINSMPIEDFVVFLDADVNLVAYPRVYTVDNFLEKFKSKNVLEKQRFQLKRLLNFVAIEKGIKQYDKTKFFYIDVKSDATRYVLHRIALKKDFLPPEINE